MRWFKRNSHAAELRAVNNALQELMNWADAQAEGYEKYALDCEYRTDAERAFAVAGAFHSMQRQIESRIKDNERELCM